MISDAEKLQIHFDLQTSMHMHYNDVSVAHLIVNQLNVAAFILLWHGYSKSILDY